MLKLSEYCPCTGYDTYCRDLLVSINDAELKKPHDKYNFPNFMHPQRFSKNINATFEMIVFIVVVI